MKETLLVTYYVFFLTRIICKCIKISSLFTNFETVISGECEKTKVQASAIVRQRRKKKKNAHNKN